MNFVAMIGLMFDVLYKYNSSIKILRWISQLQSWVVLGHLKVEITFILKNKRILRYQILTVLQRLADLNIPWTVGSVNLLL